MKFSVVTISFNQAQFLERAILSVLEQDGVEIEYIIVDPGSTDKSREIIQKYKNKFAHVIFERDHGPADGLNKGFASATGDVFCYLNSDDAFEAGAFRSVGEEFARHPEVDVFCGHAWVVDAEDRRLRRVWSDPFRRLSKAYGTSIQIQPSTFIRSSAFRSVKGFNIDNRSWWDGELLMDLFLAGAKIETLDAILSVFRLHKTSITNVGLSDATLRANKEKTFKSLMGRNWTRWDDLWLYYWRLKRQLRNPGATFERVRKGPVYCRGM